LQAYTCRSVSMSCIGRQLWVTGERGVACWDLSSFVMVFAPRSSQPVLRYRTPVRRMSEKGLEAAAVVQSRRISSSSPQSVPFTAGSLTRASRAAQNGCGETGEALPGQGRHRRLNKERTTRTREMTVQGPDQGGGGGGGGRKGKGKARFSGMLCSK
jgi:hypothetical protein